jgi:photosystem II stability/assembly factor-like uncharacterized protein
MTNAQQIFAAGLDDTFVRSNDGGNSWTKIDLGLFPAEALYHVKFRDTNVGFVAGNDRLFRTSDGGATWNPVAGFQGGSSRGISFPGPNVVIIGANGAITRSTDDGASFEVRSAYPTCPVIYGMDFRDANVGLVGGVIADTGEAGIYKTTDGGQTWVRKHPASANEIIWLDATTVLALSGGEVLKSTNEGETWTQHGTTGVGMITFQRVTPSLFVGVDAFGGIYRSADGAQTWQTVQQPIFELSASWDVHFADAQNGFVVGARGFIFRTSDGGLTWQQRNNGINMQSANIHAFDDNVLLSAGDIGFVMRSTDGGQWWSVQRLKVTGVIFNRYEDIKTMDIHAPSGLAIAAGAGGVIFRSTDRGATWQSVGYPALSPEIPPSFHKLHIVNANVAYMLARDPDGGNRNIWKTTNGGLTWTWSQITTGELYDVEFVDENLGFIVGSDATHWQGARLGYYKTVNGGATWTHRVIETPHTLLDTMKMANANVGYLMGAGYVARTTNGGQTWTPTSIGEGRLWNSMFARGNEVYAGESGYDNPQPKLWKSTDTGQTWTALGAGEAPLHLDAITMTPSGHLYVAGFQGNIWTTAPATLQLVSAVSRKAHGTAGTFDLNLPLTGEPAVESRSSGGTHTLVFTFDTTVTGGSAQVESGAGSIAGAPLFDGNTMTLDLTSVADAQTFTLMLNNIVASDGRALASRAVSFHVLAGDTNGNKIVNSSDVGQTKAQAGQPVTAANFRMDVTPNGSITSSDLGLVKSRAGQSIGGAASAAESQLRE